MRGKIRRRRVLPLVVVALASLASAGAASAATYTVNDTRDLTQSTAGAAAGTCVSTGSTCTLRSAVEAANENGGASTINLPAGTYPIGSATSSTAGCNGVGTDLTTGEFKVNPCNNSTQITVIGAGSGVTVINAGGMDRIFDVFQNGVLDVQKMTLENGDPGNSTNTTAEPNGGAIYSLGHLSAESVTFTGNTAGTGGGNAGGAIDADDNPGSTLSVTNSVFQNNTADDGGAVFTDAPNDVTLAFDLLQSNSSTDVGAGADGGTTAAGLTLNFDDFLQNVAPNDGGAVFWEGDGALNVTNSLFNQNQTTSGYGGAILDDSVSGTLFNVSNTSFDGNTAAEEGGAISDGREHAKGRGSNGLNLTQDKFSNNAGGSDGGGALALESANYPATGGTTITSSEFDGNSMPGSTEGGGAVEWAWGNLTILGSSFVLNTAPNGGGLFDERPSPAAVLTVIDSTFSRNTATGSGGGIATEDCGNSTLINDTIAFNNAGATDGGGVATDDCSYTSGGSTGTGFGIENTTIAENSGGDCNTNFATHPFTSSVDTGNNNDSDQTCFGGLGGPNDKTGVNPLLSNPANNGGPAAGGPGDTVTVQTDAEQSNSPTVDAGNNNGCPPVDERGVSRPQGKACDIGAFEFGANPLTTTTTSSRTTTTSSTTTVTSTTTTHKPPKKPKKCKKGHHRSHGRCVKNKKKHHKKHHKKHKK